MVDAEDWEGDVEYKDEDVFPDDEATVCWRYFQLAVTSLFCPPHCI